MKEQLVNTIVSKYCGLKRNSLLWSISRFPTMFSKVVYCRGVRLRIHMVKGYIFSKSMLEKERLTKMSQLSFLPMFSKLFQCYTSNMLSTCITRCFQRRVFILYLKFWKLNILTRYNLSKQKVIWRREQTGGCLYKVSTGRNKKKPQ